ncbi:hypothetical protein [Ectobacillus ponti]|uniref:Uncharacterized protein n=1 Tax=Ectobacillus ponti TaxID=2961894 RepID=A0AA42BUS7_9BACI|nr:hypothetical protein [Ectobacillus ponti]MCP8970828.1 hypothetical protein [Ectobacillus ponti]
MKERGKAGLFCGLAAVCFSGAVALYDVADNAATIGASLGTVSILAAAFFTGRKEAK